MRFFHGWWRGFGQQYAFTDESSLTIALVGRAIRPRSALPPPFGRSPERQFYYFSGGRPGGGSWGVVGSLAARALACGKVFFCGHHLIENGVYHLLNPRASLAYIPAYLWSALGAVSTGHRAYLHSKNGHLEMESVLPGGWGLVEGRSYADPRPVSGGSSVWRSLPRAFSLIRRTPSRERPNRCPISPSLCARSKRMPK